MKSNKFPFAKLLKDKGTKKPIRTEELINIKCIKAQVIVMSYKLMCSSTSKIFIYNK